LGGFKLRIKCEVGGGFQGQVTLASRGKGGTVPFLEDEASRTSKRRRRTSSDGRKKLKYGL